MKYFAMTYLTLVGFCFTASNMTGYISAGGGLSETWVEVYVCVIKKTTFLSIWRLLKRQVYPL